MFIALLGYKSHGRILTDKVTVIDTADGVVELVSCDDISEIKVNNLVRGGLIWSTLCGINSEFKIGDYGLMFKGNMRFVYKQMWTVVLDGNEKIKSINDVAVKNNIVGTCDIVYPFLFKEYMVLRMIPLAKRDGWLSVAVRPDGVIEAVWTSNMEYVDGNKSLVMQIDLCSEV